MWRLLVPTLILLCAIGSPIGLPHPSRCFMTSLVSWRERYGLVIFPAGWTNIDLTALAQTTATSRV
jgi:hypothetical protein